MKLTSSDVYHLSHWPWSMKLLHALVTHKKIGLDPLIRAQDQAENFRFQLSFQLKTYKMCICYWKGNLFQLCVWTSWMWWFLLQPGEKFKAEFFCILETLLFWSKHWFQNLWFWKYFFQPGACVISETSVVGFKPVSYSWRNNYEAVQHFFVI